jgi:hypothetical protein
MSSHDTLLKTSFEHWLRLGSQFSGIIGDLEEEIQKMRERKVPENLIEQKDELVEKLVAFYNTTDQLITAYRIGIANKQAEVMIMSDALAHAMRTELRERIFKRLAEDVNVLQERKELKRELTNVVNGKDHTQQKI